MIQAILQNNFISWGEHTILEVLQKHISYEAAEDFAASGKEFLLWEASYLTPMVKYRYLESVAALDFSGIKFTLGEGVRLGKKGIEFSFSLDEYNSFLELFLSNKADIITLCKHTDHVLWALSGTTFKQLVHKYLDMYNSRLVTLGFMELTHKKVKIGSELIQLEDN